LLLMSREKIMSHTPHGLCKWHRGIRRQFSQGLWAIECLKPIGLDWFVVFSA
jgi:hypothetical protein